MDLKTGISLMKESNYEDAAKVFSGYIESNPSEPEGYINMANLLSILGDRDRAILFNERAIELDPDSSAPYYGLGVLAYQEDQFQKAIEWFLTAQQKGLHDADLFYMLGMSHYQLQSFAHAQANLSYAHELNKEDVEIAFQYGLCLAQQEQLEAAQQLFIDVIKQDATHADAYYNLGVIYVSNEAIDEALKCFDLALNNQEDHLLAGNAKRVIEDALNRG
ncbi:tetratricopeptide repeat protein [Shouchella sp. JSM 1781072]|uniref:tetratricopeptide repeat protein n=1 Tax=Shouchella sp. JSM 1781072 TaxID=3344581 RepID=UPI0035BF469E